MTWLFLGVLEDMGGESGFSGGGVCSFRQSCGSRLLILDVLAPRNGYLGYRCGIFFAFVWDTDSQPLGHERVSFSDY